MPRALSRLAALAATLLAAAACAPGAGDAARPDSLAWVPAGVDPRMVERRSDGTVIASADSLRRIPGYVVDSIFPPPEALRRWKAKLGGEGPTALAGGAPTALALFRAYAAGLAAGDRAAVDSLTITEREFAWLYYADSPEAGQRLMPAVAWEMMQLRAGAGLARARELVLRDGGTAEVSAVRCGPTAIPVGTGTMRGPCVAVLRRPGGARDSVSLARFVLERDGRVKLMSFANDL